MVADTHALVWYLLDQPRLSADALAALEQAVSSGDLIHLSAISIVEIVYLVERAKLPALALSRLISDLDRPGGRHSRSGVDAWQLVGVTRPSVWEDASLVVDVSR